MAANRRVSGLVEAGRQFQFPKGKSGNPSGRPSTKLLTDALKARLSMRLPAPTAKRLKLRTTATYSDAVAMALIDEAIRGNVQAAREVMDRVQGKVPQAVQLDAQFEGITPIQIASDDAVVAKLLGGDSPARSAELNLYDGCISLVRTSDDEQVMQAATALALLLKKKGGSNGVVA